MTVPALSRVRSPQKPAPATPVHPALDPNLAALRERFARHKAAALAGRRPAPTAQQATAGVWKTAAAKVARAPECSATPGRFELPDGTEYAAPAGPGGIPPTPFAALDSERAIVRKRVHIARRALVACTNCPLLAQCRRDVLDDISAGAPPTNSVVGGVAWTADGVPDVHVHEPVDPQARYTHTLDALSGVRLDPVRPATDWLPDDLRPLPRYDEVTVREAMSQRRIDRNLEDLQDDPSADVRRREQDRFITESWLDLHPAYRVHAQTVITYLDEMEIVRRAVGRGLSPNTLAAILLCGWEKAAGMLLAAGSDVVSETAETTNTSLLLREVRTQRASH
ncbi:MAG: hypothetical protein L0H59_10870 [Tomitella sp.]|nr:hypothetical protein [Tomitella sp.]